MHGDLIGFLQGWGYRRENIFFVESRRAGFNDIQVLLNAFPIDTSLLRVIDNHMTMYSSKTFDRSYIYITNLLTYTYE